jgi:small subunit ribosomal protein S1
MNLNGNTLEEKNTQGGENRDNELAKLYEASIKEFKPGQIVKGKIIDKQRGAVLIDIGYKSEGLLPLNEFRNPEKVNVGDDIEVLIESLEDEDGMVQLSKSKAEKVKGWERIINNFNEGDNIEGTVVRKVKGGFTVDIGVEAFMPASLSTLRGFSNMDQLLNQTAEFKIVKINKPRKNIVLSRKDVLLKEKEEGKAKLMENLVKGMIAPGTVKNITDFGAFIDLGGIDGLLHITDMSWGRISHPSEMVAIGDKIDVMVLDFDKENMRVSLGLKQKTPNPWLDVDSKYPIGSKVKGKVVNLVPYGAFVELEKGIEGLIHISEFSWTKRYNHPNELLAIGDIIEAVVLDIDKDNQKISLGLKQLEADPWVDVEEKYPVNSHVKGKVRNLTDYGAFVELEDGIDGLIHVSDMSWTRKINHPKEVLKKAQRVEAIVLSVDKDNRKISLGLKQLIEDPWKAIVDKYKENTAVSGSVTKITNFGLFVEIEKDLEGLIHVSEIELPEGQKLEEAFKVGDKVQARVVKVDGDQRKIALSLKDVQA